MAQLKDRLYWTTIKRDRRCLKATRVFETKYICYISHMHSYFGFTFPHLEQWLKSISSGTTRVPLVCQIQTQASLLQQFEGQWDGHVVQAVSSDIRPLSFHWIPMSTYRLREARSVSSRPASPRAVRWEWSRGTPPHPLADPENTTSLPAPIRRRFLTSTQPHWRTTRASRPGDVRECLWNGLNEQDKMKRTKLGPDPSNSFRSNHEGDIRNYKKNKQHFVYGLHIAEYTEKKKGLWCFWVRWAKQKSYLLGETWLDECK